MIKNVILDVGGVLLDLDRATSVERFRQLGVTDAEELLDAYRQSGIFLDLERGDISAEDFARSLTESYGQEITPEDVKWALMGFIKRVAEEKFAFLAEELAPHYRLLALSNTNPPLFDFFESDRFLSSGRTLTSFFDQVFASFRMGLCKPERGIFVRVIEESGIRPEETLFLDDGPANTDMARSLGMVAYTCRNEEDWRPVLRQLLLD